jgi:aryl-alcohol dehydrogenase-like predicted oxidoreductase
MQKRKIAHFQVSPIGLGCMNLSHAYGVPPSAEQAERVLLGALDAGYDFFDTATLYGFGANETLVGEVLAPHRKRFTLASKCGMGGEMLDGKLTRVIDGSPAKIRAQCEASLKRLKTDVIDLYYLHRWDKKVPVEESVGALADLQKAGKIQSIGLSEVSASTLRRAYKEAPIAAMQTEYSLWTRNPEIAVLDACKDLNVTFVAFSPVARGFLCGDLTDVSTLDAKDIRKTMPRFSADNYPENLKLLPDYLALAQNLGCSGAQLALAWMLNKHPAMITIPGTTQVAHMQDNFTAAHIQLDARSIVAVEALLHKTLIKGNRYNAQARSEVDTEEEPLCSPS